MTITIPDGTSFHDWLIGLFKYWYPDRDEASIKETLRWLYNWQQVWPDKDGNMPPACMAQVTNMAVMYRSLDQ